MKAVITVANVIGAGMAPWDVNKFVAAFGTEAEVTIENVRRAKKFGLAPDAFFAAIATPDNLNALYERKQEIYTDRARAERLMTEEHDQHRKNLTANTERLVEEAFVSALAKAVTAKAPAEQV